MDSEVAVQEKFHFCTRQNLQARLSILRTIWMENLHPDCLTKCIPRSDKMKLELELFGHKDLKPIENLWVELKTKLHASRTSNLEELERFAKEEWANCSGDVCETC